MLLDRDGYYDLPPGKIATVVTFLEMTEPAPRRPGPTLSHLTLRRVELPDPGWYRDLYRRIGRDWLWFSRLALPEDALRAILHDPLVEVHALEVAGRAEGLLELDRRVADEIELAFLGLTAGMVGQGAGRWLMDRAQALAWAHRPRRFWVHTCTLDHPGALGFYLRSGFRAYRRAVEVADDPRLTGLAPRDAAPSLPVLG